MLTRPNCKTRRAICLALFLLSLTAVGCVERRYTIRTDPPGALVFVNGEESGISPVSVSYEYYGDRRVTIQAEGYETIQTELPIPAPWWNNAFTGFFTENLIPFTLRDEREFRFTMAPAVSPETGDLVGRGQQLRQQAQAPPPERPGGFFRFFAL
ncbi:PEGA domain-containing protein [Tautonia marina]|uniref:PEGA domain-containing protein n=1 Tax=Tautonia marina TaxID=2653855 RepID=UPI001260EA5D|nr:PEGA domain-containing protein [Tautonia marina]